MAAPLLSCERGNLCCKDGEPDMTPETRFERIEMNLEKAGMRMDRLEGNIERLEANIERLGTKIGRLGATIERVETNIERVEVQMEKYQHANELRFERLTQMQTVLMETQNRTFELVERVMKNVENLIRGRGPNGKET